VRRTEISVVHFITEISVRLTTEISVKLASKADETNFYISVYVLVLISKKNKSTFLGYQAAQLMRNLCKMLLDFYQNKF
jgi:hypothetical protein